MIIYDWPHKMMTMCPPSLWCCPLGSRNVCRRRCILRWEWGAGWSSRTPVGSWCSEPTMRLPECRRRQTDEKDRSLQMLLTGRAAYWLCVRALHNKTCQKWIFNIFHAQGPLGPRNEYFFRWYWLQNVTMDLTVFLVGLCSVTINRIPHVMNCKRSQKKLF